MSDADVPVTARDWGLHATVPSQDLQSVVRSALHGRVDLAVRTARTNVLVCALPKSAGLHLTRLLGLALGLGDHQVGFDGRGGGLYWPRAVLAKYRAEGTVSHCHALPDPTTCKQVLALDLRPLVVTRHVLDALVSRRDMLVRDRWTSSLLAPAAMARFLAAGDEERMDVVIDLFAPFFLNFVAAWDAVRDDARLRPVFATHEELVADETALVLRLADELGLACDAERVRAASDAIRAAGGVNLSRGEPGRGARELTPAQVERVRVLAARLGCDEARLGLPAEAPAATERAA